MALSGSAGVGCARDDSFCQLSIRVHAQLESLLCLGGLIPFQTKLLLSALSFNVWFRDLPSRIIRTVKSNFLSSYSAFRSSPVRRNNGNLLN